MSTNLASSPRAYRQSAVLTASPGQLVVMLYDGAHRFLNQAAIAMRAEQVELAHNKLRRAELIIEHLQSTLDLSQGEIAERLEQIYSFCLRHLNDARARQDPEPIERVDGLLSELREAWAQVARS